MIDAPLDKLPVGDLGWSRLLDALFAADPTDETEWLEFKAGLDPAGRPGQAAIAKAVVAFANREPKRALQWFGGSALIVIGMEPGRLVGAPSVDPAVLDDGVRRYLSVPPPEWEIKNVDFRDQRVTVLVVASPRPGDPIHHIRKAGDGVEDGTIYVRTQGKSEPARSSDILRLSERVAARESRIEGVRLEVEPTWPDPAGMPHGDLLQAQQDGEQPSWRRATSSDWWLEEWLRLEEHRLLSPLDPPDYSSMPYGFALKSAHEVTGFYEEPDGRDPERYRRKVREYLAACEAALPNAPLVAAAYLLPWARVAIVNSTDRNFEEVLVEATVEGGAGLLQHLPGRNSVRHALPTPPRVWGPRRRSVLDRLGNTDFNDSESVSPFRPPVPELRTDVAFEPVHLRPQSRVTLGERWVPFFAQPEVTALALRWRVTATSHHGAFHGTVVGDVTGIYDLTKALEHRVGDDQVVVSGRGMSWMDQR